MVNPRERQPRRQSNATATTPEDAKRWRSRSRPSTSTVTCSPTPTARLRLRHRPGLRPRRRPSRPWSPNSTGNLDVLRLHRRRRRRRHRQQARRPSRSTRSTTPRWRSAARRLDARGHPRAVQPRRHRRRGRKSVLGYQVTPAPATGSLTCTVAGAAAPTRRLLDTTGEYQVGYTVSDGPAGPTTACLFVITASDRSTTPWCRRTASRPRRRTRRWASPCRHHRHRGKPAPTFTIVLLPSSNGTTACSAGALVHRYTRRPRTSPGPTPSFVWSAGRRRPVVAERHGDDQRRRRQRRPAGARRGHHDEPVNTTKVFLRPGDRPRGRPHHLHGADLQAALARQRVDRGARRPSHSPTPGYFGADLFHLPGDADLPGALQHRSGERGHQRGPELQHEDHPGGHHRQAWWRPGRSGPAVAGALPEARGHAEDGVEPPRRGTHADLHDRRQRPVHRGHQRQRHGHLQRSGGQHRHLGPAQPGYTALSSGDGTYNASTARAASCRSWGLLRDEPPSAPRTGFGPAPTGARSMGGCPSPRPSRPPRSSSRAREVRRGRPRAGDRAGGGHRRRPDDGVDERREPPDDASPRAAPCSGAAAARRCWRKGDTSGDRQFVREALLRLRRRHPAVRGRAGGQGRLPHRRAHRASTGPSGDPCDARPRRRSPERSALAATTRSCRCGRELLADLDHARRRVRPAGRRRARASSSSRSSTASAWSRWSFVGRNPLATLRRAAAPSRSTGTLPDGRPARPGHPRRGGGDPARAYRAPVLDELPPLHGGLAGLPRLRRRRARSSTCPTCPPDDQGHPDAVVSRHRPARRVRPLAPAGHAHRQRARRPGPTTPSLDAAYDAAVVRLDALAADGARPRRAARGAAAARRGAARGPLARWGRGLPAGPSRSAKEHILAGDIFQVVLAQRFDFDLDAEPFDVYRVLRQVNPSPYMYFVRHPGLTLVGLVARADGAAARRQGDLPADRRHPPPRAAPTRRTGASAAELQRAPQGAGRARDARSTWPATTSGGSSSSAPSRSTR